MLSWLASIKQCFDMLGSKLTDYIKRRSNCCNNINVYNPKNCGILGDASNRFIRAITPDCSKLKSNSNEFYTPKN